MSGASILATMDPTTSLLDLYRD